MGDGPNQEDMDIFLKNTLLSDVKKGSNIRQEWRSEWLHLFLVIQ